MLLHSEPDLQDTAGFELQVSDVVELVPGMARQSVIRTPLRALRHDSLSSLRAAVARIEARSGLPFDRRGLPAPARQTVRLGDGDLAFDAMLGGGLRRGTLNEIVAAHRQDDAAASGFAAALAVRCTETSGNVAPLVWIVEDRAAGETGVPYRPGLVAQGLDPDRIILVRTRDARMTLWACEEALRLKAPVVLAELWTARHYGLAPSRRLLLAAQAGRGTALLLHTGLSGRVETLSSAAETRFAVAACTSPRIASAGHRLDIPGPSAFAVRLVKQRLGVAQGFEGDRIHSLVWNHAQRCFDDHPLSVGLSAPPADRPAQTTGRAAGEAAAILRFG